MLRKQIYFSPDLLNEKSARIQVVVPCWRRWGGVIAVFYCSKYPRFQVN